MRGPGRPLEALDLLKRQLADTVRVREDEPVRVVSIAIPGWFVALPVAQSQELPIELGKSPSVGRVDGSVQQLGVLSHDLLQSAAHASTLVPLSFIGTSAPAAA